MTKRQKEIIIALRDGARLRVPASYGHTWELEGLPLSPGISKWVFQATIDKMKADDLLYYPLVGPSTLKPTDLALSQLEK